MQSNARAADLTALLGQAPTDATDHEAVSKFIRRLAEAGCSVMFVLPGSKLPADMRSPQRRTADDKSSGGSARGAVNRRLPGCAAGSAERGKAYHHVVGCHR